MPRVRGGIPGKQLRFIEEYLVDLNATRAAKAAGYKESTAYRTGADLLKKPHIQQALQEAADKRSERVGITADSVLKEIGKLAFANVKHLFDERGRLIPVEKLPDEVAASITEVTAKTIEGKDGDPLIIERKYKMADKKSSLELLGRHLKLFTDNVDLRNPDGSLTPKPTRIELVAPCVDSKD